jgi:Protein of unknown function (DUF2971)
MSINYEEGQELNRQYAEELKKIYPTFKFGNSSVASTGGIVTRQQYEVSIRQDFLQGTSYDPQNQKEFIHYTSLESLYGILNSGEIRLYDLNNMNDPFEFNYIIKNKNLKLLKEQIEFFKKSLFITSLCAFQGKDSFDLWRLYGKNGQGVSIVFEVINNEYNWGDVLLGKVIYGTENKASEQLRDAIEITNHFVADKKMKLDTLPKYLALLMLHHKNQIWSSEQEYRLSTFTSHYSDDDFFPKEGLSTPSAGANGYYLNSSGKRLSYISLAFEHKIRKELSDKCSPEDIKTLLMRHPQIKIKKVIAGYALSKEFIEKLNDFIWSFSYEKWGNGIHVEKSCFYEDFNDEALTSH